MPGSIRALRRQADPVRGGGRIPITKRRTVGRPQFREPGTDTLSRQEEAIADAIEDAYATIPRETLLNAVETADTAGYARTVLGYLTAASSGIEEVLLESFVSSGETSAIDLGRELSRQYRQVGKAETPSPSEVALRFRFNATDPRATTWARNEAGRLITNMAQSEQAMFRRLVEQSFTEGRTPQSAASSIFRQLQTVTPSPTARDFAESIGGNLSGLTERYERAVMNRVADLGDDLAKRGVSGTRALEQMRKEGDKYATKLRRARSRTIARTERMMAHNEARLLSYQQAIDDGLMSREHSRKVWSTGPFDVCPICVAMSGVEAKIADPFTLPNGSQVQAPPGHPNCRCTLQTRTDVDLYNPPQALGTGVPGDPYRVGGREVSDQGRKFDTPVTDTQRIHTTTRNGRTAYKPERIRQVHDPWVRESLEDGVAHGDTRVTFMGGGSGAGKGSIQKSGDVTFRRGTTLVDSDKAKEAIPEYRQMLDAGDNKAAAFVHEESSDMAQRLMAESIDSGFDTVLDGTGDSSFEKMAGKVARAREQGGQRVVAEYVTIDTDEALRRAAQRAANTGREVPEDVIHGTHEAVSKIFPKLADADTFDELRLWDNMGDRPELIYERIDGVERVLNPERFEAFLRKDPDYIPGSRRALATPPSTVDDIVYGTNDTQGVFTEFVGGQRRYTAARTESVHRPWLDDLLSAGQASDEPTMTFLGGGSGAGKGTITDPSKGGVVRFRDGTIKVDSDKAKEVIPEYRKLVADDDPIAAAFVHEESSDMAAQALAESLDRGFDTVLDGTGDSSIEKLASKVAKAREQGAKRVTAEYVTIDIDDALARAASRAKRTGREVPEDVIRGTHESVSRVLPEAIKRDLFDEVRLWDNTGTPPELIYEKIGGVERILNPARWEAFLRKNPDYVPPRANIPPPSTPAARRARRTREQILADQRRRAEEFAAQYDVTVDEAIMFLDDVPKLKERARAEAARRLDEVFAQLDAPGLGSTSIPDPRDVPAEVRVYLDWFRNLSRREQQRLRQSGWLRRTAASIDEFDEAYATQFGLETRGLPGQALEEHWLRLTREYDLLNQARRGRRPRNFDRYGGTPDYNRLLPDLRQEGWDVNVIMAGDEFETAAMIARTQLGAAADEAYSALGAAARPARGPAPWRMSFQSWEDEVRDLESRLRNETLTTRELERLDELVPRVLDDGQDYEALYSTIIQVARVAEMDVAEYATIPWL